VKVEPSLTLVTLTSPSGQTSDKMLKWPSVSDSQNGNHPAKPAQVVYVLVQHIQSTWKLIGVTIKPEISLEPTLSTADTLSSLRILAVSSGEGLVRVFNFPQGEKSGKNGIKSAGKIEEKSTGEESENIGKSWNLRKVSMVHQKFLVVTEVTWDSPKIAGRKAKSNFLLTWEISGGLLRGNLITDTNSVAISLLPDTLYTIQVRFFLLK